MIIQKFEEQVEAFAEKPAVVTENKQLTYRELNDSANGVAFAIRNQKTTSPGKKTDRVVGLLFEHGADMIIGVLGTLKADKIYVPLDITYPENRLAYMLADSQAYLVLTNTKNLSLSEKLVEKMRNDVQIVNIDTMCNATNCSQFERTPSGDKLAYILFTSGSTGKPKGIVQNHKNVCYYIRNWSERFSLSPSDRMTLFSAFSHDGAGQDMFGALHNGATLYPYNILNRANIAGLSKWLIDEKITIWHSVPTLYRYFVDTLAAQEIDNRHFQDLRFILLGGEQVRKYDIEMFKRFFLNAKFANVYGQTESSVNSIWCISAGDPVNKILVGDPLDKTKMVIVDEEGTVVEDIGVGEIVVSCPHIAPGYWQDEQSSRLVFFSDPEMGLLYRTGDLGRLLTDGNIEFLGRKDSQVKIRGFRIEVGEVETILLNHDALKEVKVIARNDNQGNAHLYAYYVPHPSISKAGAEVRLTVSDLRKYLSSELPEHMIPSYFVELEQMPLTPNGKVDQKRLPEPEHTRPQLAVTYVAPGTRIEKQISDIWREILQVDKVGINDNFFDLGGTSFDILRITAKLYEMYKQDIPVISFFQYPTIGSFVEYLNRDREVKGVEVRLDREVAGIGSLEKPSEIAVIGMSGRFPGSKDLDEFWNNLKNGVESILFFSDQELMNEPEAESRPLDNPNYIKARGTIGDIAFFDAGFFNFTPGEAGIMDPQLRIMHELSWQALETAGYEPGVYDGLIGIYAGNAATHYWTTLTWLNQKSMVDVGFLNNNYSTIVSYKLNLKGPSFILKTACSTSLVAIHLACQGLKNHECDMALAGGVSIWLPNRDGYMYQEGMIYSRDGHCRTFDARASGTVFGNGAGIVLLKPLESAIADGDPLLAIIKGSGINNDGSRKIGLASPSIEGQSEIIRKVYSDSGIDPESISYVETHGTGTVMGDPVELEALRLAFNTSKKQYCYIGSVKTNIGHLNIASGIAGFIKTVLSLTHRMLPPNLHFETPNPRFDFENSPFLVVTKLTKWETEPKRAGVSSFGIGGTNAHLILEEAPQIASSSESRSLNMFLLAAQSKTALQKATENLADYLKENPNVNLTDVAYTLQVGRKACKQRRMVLCSRVDEAIDLLMSSESTSTPETGKMQTAVFDEGDRPVVFMFPGQGAQYTDMGLGLYQTEPVFREEMDRCFEILKPLLDYDMKEILYPENRENKQIADRVNRTEITQPVLFIFEYALARLLMKWGVKPSAMIGHSIGEYVAACLSGVFSLEDALRVVVLRGKLMQQMPSGSMLSVPMPEEEIKLLLLEANAVAAPRDELSLAAVNTTSYCVVSGSHNAIEAFEERLRKRGSECKRLHTSHAFHSVMMEAMLQEFREKLKDISFNKPVIPYISNLTGRWITVEEVFDPGYWTRHVRETVRFSDGLTELLKDANTVFLEVGPGRSLATFVRQHKNKKPAQMNLNLVRHPKENISDSYYLLGRIGRLWLNGGKIDWQHFYTGEKRHRVSLPTYPFEKKRYWLEGDFSGMTRPGSTAEPQLKKKINPADWFYMQIWNSRTSTSSVFQIPHTAKNTETFNWLVFIDECGIGTRLVRELSGQGHYVMIVRTGTGLVKTGDHEFTINPSQADDYKALLSEYLVRGKIPTRILHLWNITAADDEQDYQWLQELGYYSLIYLAQAIGEQNWKENLDISVLTNRLLAVNGRERLVPSKASILGTAQVIPREYANINCRCIDIEIPDAGPPQTENIISYLVDELLSETTDTLIAFRDDYRWVRSFAPMPLAEPEAEAPRLKRKGVYLVVGGLGGIGLVLAEYLARSVGARLVLTGRTPLPDRKKWELWLDSHPPQEAIGNKIRKVLHLEEAGAEVLVVSADVTDKAQMQKVVNRARERFGKIDGVIHSAGVPGGGLIQRHTREMSERVLNSKIAGTLILDELLKDEKLDFFILCSSISSITAPLGQVAYCAANAFMDSFAYYKMLNHHTFTVSIDWDAWSEVGMAAEAVRKFTNKSTSPPGVSHEQAVDYPLFNSCRIINSDQVIYVSRLGVKNCWLLDEHRIQGKATLPGTGYLEMARAAVTHHTGNPFVELREFLSLAPIIVEEDEEKEIQVILKRKGDEYIFSFISQVNPGQDKWMDYARGKAFTLIDHESRQFSVKEIEDTCGEWEMVIRPEDFTSKKGAMTLGPRWNNLRTAKFGTKQALGFLELPGEFTADLDSYKLHPAILDVGNVLMRQKKDGDGPYVPVFYKRLSIKGDLPRKTLFHVKAAKSNKLNAETLRYSIIIMDETGKELVNIEDYTLRKVKLDAVPADSTNVPFSESPALQHKKEVAHPYSFFVTSPALDDRDISSLQEQELLKDAISPREGVDVFRRVLGSSECPQVAISTIDLLGRLERDWQLIRGRSGKEEGERETTRSPAKHARPELSTEYVAPDTEIERRLAPIWEDLLGIEQVGAYDDFFELGGDSLKAVNFSTRIHKELNTEVPISEFFNHPNIKELAQYIKEHSGTSDFYSVNPVEKKEYYPLSSTQQRLFILKQLEEANVAYNLSDIAVLNIDLNIEMLNRSFGKLIDRHEALRTSFRLIHGEPVQVVHESVEFEIAYHELDKKTGRTKSREEAIITDFIKPFDLSQPPLMRAGLIKSVDQRYILIVDFHHIIFDGVSFPIFYKEILAFYKEEELASLRIQYKEYVEWINRQENKEIEKRQEAYWLEMYSLDHPVLQLPLDYERPPVQSFAGCTLDFAVESEATDALRQLVRDEEATLFMVLLTVLNVLLMKLSGQEDIVVGTSVAGRRHTDLAPIIGVFVNTLALRNYPAGNKRFRTFLKEVKAATLRAFENQEYPFEDLVDKIAVDRDLSRNPLFDVMFILNSQFQSIQRSKPKQQNPELSDYKYRKTASQFDISFNCFEVDDWLLFEVEYCTHLFERESIERLMGCFNEIIAFVAKHPDETLLDIEILSEQEKKQVLHEFNNTGIEYPRNSTLHQLFQEQVERTPDRVAVVGSSHLVAYEERRREELMQLTYQELNMQSMRLAHLLKEKGVEVGTIVAVLVERTPRLMVSLLGILKSGGAYLPLDPEYPSKRIHYILKNSTSALLLTSPGLSKEVKELRGLEIETVFVEEIGKKQEASGIKVKQARGESMYPLVSRDIEEVEQFRSLEKETPGRVFREPATCNLQPVTISSNLCYVIYTSGSTGNPKGVAVTHQNVVNFIKGITDKIDFSPAKTILALTTVSFDIFLLETLLPVTCGLKVVIADEEEQTDPNLLANVILNQQVEMIQATPSRLQLLLSLQDDLWCLRYVKELMVGGEALPAHLFNSVKSNFSGRIYNLYGPTETTVWSTVKDLTRSQPDDITIGSPIANTRVYILNGDNRLQPIGVPGVLLIGGDGVAAGYLDNYQLTAESFITDPFAGIEGRLYMTGDLARWLPDGELEFLGRIDHQVKIRGYRIELEEIEEQLVNHQDIKEAVVVSKINNDNDKYLAAYIVPVSAKVEKDLESKALNEYLAQRLPHYMIPSYFVALEEIPLTPNGKINRRALPEPEESRLKSTVSYIEPTNEVEKIIAAIWKEELGLGKIGTNSNFFSLGGNSLDILKVNYRLKEAFARDIPVSAQFRYRTIGDFARYLSRETDELSKRDRSEALKRGEKNKQKRLQVRRERTQ